MKTKLNFKSQICTSREQSERLLALGLKKETADMRWERISEKYAYYPSTKTPYVSSDIPAWSLHRLIEMMPPSIKDGYHYSLVYDIHRDWVVYMAYASGERNPYNRYLWESQNTNIYDAFIDCIEWLIKEGYFNKEYLV